MKLTFLPGSVLPTGEMASDKLTIDTARAWVFAHLAGVIAVGQPMALSSTLSSMPHLVRFSALDNDGVLHVVEEFKARGGVKHTALTFESHTVNAVTIYPPTHKFEESR